jgi:hypothetical protein
MSVRAKHHCLAVDQGVVDRQGSNRVGDPSQPIGEVGSIPGPQGDAVGVLAGERSVAVMLDLVQPSLPGGRMGDEGRLTRLDEADRRDAPGMRGAPRHPFVCRGCGKAEAAHRSLSGSAKLGWTLRRDFLRLRRRNHLGAWRDHDVGTRLRQVDTLIRLRLLYRRRWVDHIWLCDRYRLVGLHRSVPLGGLVEDEVQGDDLSGTSRASLLLRARNSHSFVPRV